MYQIFRAAVKPQEYGLLNVLIHLDVDLRMHLNTYIKHINIELFIWPLALGLLFFMDPHKGTTLCPLQWMGLKWCPGCGLGHAIHYVLHGQWALAWHSHPLGFFAVPMLLYRSFQLGKQQVQIFHYLKNNPA